MTAKYRRLTGVFLVAVILVSPVLTSAGAGADRQPAAVDAGKDVYRQYCLACHAADGLGNNGAYPDLTSARFKKTKGTYDRAFAFISQNMPQNAPGSLSEDQYAAVVKYVLSLNGIPTEFSDIEGHWAQKEIAFLSGKNFVDGYTADGRLAFKPDQNITRAEFIRYLVKAKQLFLSGSSVTDLTDIVKSKDKIYILTAVEYGIVDGYPDHTFRPSHSVSRAEIAAILARSESLSPAAAKVFNDVSEQYWANPAIGAVVQAKLFNGYEDGTFKPGSPITRAEAAAVIYRLIQ